MERPTWNRERGFSFRRRGGKGSEKTGAALAKKEKTEESQKGKKEKFRSRRMKSKRKIL